MVYREDAGSILVEMITFITFNGGGVKASIKNLGRFYDDARHLPIDNFMVDYLEDPSFWNNWPHPIVLCGGWDDRFDIIVDALSCPIFVYWHTNILGSELSWGHTVGDGGQGSSRMGADFGVELLQLNHIKTLLDNGSIRGIFVPAEKTAQALDFVEHLPNLFDVGWVDINPARKIPNSIGCFVAHVPWKNLCSQAVAVQKSGKDLYLNGGIKRRKRRPHEELSVPYLTAFECLGIQPRFLYLGAHQSDTTPYWRAVCSMTLTLQVTCTETLNYAALESIACGTPVLVSPMCPIANMDEEFKKMCCVEEIDNPQEITNQIHRVTRNEFNSERAVLAGRRAIEAYQKKNMPIADRSIQKIRAAFT